MDSQRIALRAADGVALGGYAWRHAAPDPAGPRPVVVINAATSVRCRYYARFAAYLHQHGFDVLTYDYRGIGESRPASLRGFQASWMDWGEKDFEAVLGYVRSHFPGQPVDVVAHSIGGFVTGLAPSARGLRRIFTMGAQYAYWRDYAAGKRLRMLAKWHVVMPLLAACLGYFPGRRLGWLEDTPRGVVRDWSFMGPRFEGRGGPDHRVAAMAAVTAPILALSVTDDEFGTEAAVGRLLAYFTGSARTHLRLAPAALGLDGIGHFAFFHERFRDTLWPIALGWLSRGEHRLAGATPIRCDCVASLVDSPSISA
ncbi:alpha/beta fold hydrolase [Achromobacter xylosoxidans]|uniref:alpha/beta hydrolase family protein n=1 Tax=Alcaligenes xylosoxydans xylosoxydans TaxID=85698 RepID=UPI0006AC6532|nr:alpha/beta fold hydrolase [Achromobacter xylosoxidans]KOQ21861.1 alpha/beta hydrolase [Achromobacter xylosoxidans]KOQ25619.1 alpha/beta hydrolase [Achromobacter xylosoxidans]KOQ28732.1 alpha/beta hydrolase [Achromobacter xylosoxidans]KOQ40185.1 alpha/beta hydrolase [Achromobacter xylosoxidans]KOQ51140.1 alpha/beta hydrolase [Achromobacter xylosoxidans]